MSKNGLISQLEATKKAWGIFKDNQEKEWGLAGIDTGIHHLNLSIGGWLPGKLTTVAGRSGHGKTAVLTPIFDAGRRIVNGKKASFLFFTWEMASNIIVDRHVCHRAGVTMSFLTQGAKLLQGGLLEKVKEAYSDSKSLDVTYQQSSTDITAVRNISLEFIDQCKERSKIEGISIQPVIVIDYIGMAKFEGSGLRTYGIGDFMNGLKQMASQTGCSVLTLAQINRGADDKAVPQKQDLSDSQSIENASDNLILLHRPEYNQILIVKDPESGDYIDSKDKLILRVWKSRDYGLSDNLVDCTIRHFRIKSPDHNYDTKYWELYESEEFWLKHFKLDKSTIALKMA